MTKIVQIGCGYWGKNLTRNFSEIGVLAGIVDGDVDTANRMSETYGVSAMSFEKALENPEVDGISLATPAESHASLAMQALKAGKHVYVEKPLTLEINDAKTLIAFAELKDRRLMVGHLLQYHPVFLALRNQLQDGLIGELQYIYSNRMSLGKFRTEENVLWSFAPHDFSMMLGLVGEEPSSVTAQGASFITPGLADWCTVQCVFPGGVRGHIQTSWLHPFKEQRLVVIGTNGMMVFEDSEPEWDQKLALYRHRIDTSGIVPSIEKANCEYLVVEKGEPLKNECQHFVDCIEARHVPRTDGREGLAVLKALTKAERSLAASLNGVAT